MEIQQLTPIEKAQVEKLAFDTNTPEILAKQYQKVLLSALNTMREYNLPDYRIMFLQQSNGDIQLWID